MIIRRHFQILLILLVLITASLACNFPANNNDYPPTANPMSAEETARLEEELRATLENRVPDGEVTLTITQQQINEFMISQINEQDEQLLSDPVVVLTNNQIELYGKIIQGGLSINTKMVFQPRVDPNGDPKLEVVSIDLGGFPAPDSLKNRVEDIVDDTLADYLSEGSRRFKVSDITIGEGQMTVTGTPQ